MGEAGDALGAARAVAIAVRGLPSDASDVWVGKSDRYGNRVTSTGLNDTSQG